MYGLNVAIALLQAHLPKDDREEGDIAEIIDMLQKAEQQSDWSSLFPGVVEYLQEQVRDPDVLQAATYTSRGKDTVVYSTSFHYACLVTLSILSSVLPEPERSGYAYHYPILLTVLEQLDEIQKCVPADRLFSRGYDPEPTLPISVILDDFRTELGQHFHKNNSIHDSSRRLNFSFERIKKQLEHTPDTASSACAIIAAALNERISYAFANHRMLFNLVRTLEYRLCDTSKPFSAEERRPLQQQLLTLKAFHSVSDVYRQSNVQPPAEVTDVLQQLSQRQDDIGAEARKITSPADAGDAPQVVAIDAQLKAVEESVAAEFSAVEQTPNYQTLAQHLKNRFHVPAFVKELFVRIRGRGSYDTDPAGYKTLTPDAVRHIHNIMATTQNPEVIFNAKILLFFVFLREAKSFTNRESAFRIASHWPAELLESINQHFTARELTQILRRIAVSEMAPEYAQEGMPSSRDLSHAMHYFIQCAAYALDFVTCEEDIHILHRLKDRYTHPREATEATCVEEAVTFSVNLMNGLLPIEAAARNCVRVFRRHPNEVITPYLLTFSRLTWPERWYIDGNELSDRFISLAKTNAQLRELLSYLSINIRSRDTYHTWEKVITALRAPYLKTLLEKFRDFTPTHVFKLTSDTNFLHIYQAIKDGLIHRDLIQIPDLVAFIDQLEKENYQEQAKSLNALWSHTPDGAQQSRPIYPLAKALLAVKDEYSSQKDQAVYKHVEALLQTLAHGFHTPRVAVQLYKLLPEAHPARKEIQEFYFHAPKGLIAIHSSWHQPDFLEVVLSDGTYFGYEEMGLQVDFAARYKELYDAALSEDRQLLDAHIKQCRMKAVAASKDRVGRLPVGFDKQSPQQQKNEIVMTIVVKRGTSQINQQELPMLRYKLATLVLPNEVWGILEAHAALIGDAGKTQAAKDTLVQLIREEYESEYKPQFSGWGFVGTVLASVFTLGLAWVFYYAERSKRYDVLTRDFAKYDAANPATAATHRAMDPSQFGQPRPDTTLTSEQRAGAEQRSQLALAPAGTEPLNRQCFLKYF